ncbi:hypothetical protein AVEN_138727-1 [Araneus ventricosus]|uniref:Uncharacterized protein n=1 Tax=Araneus ventricosus TaxID=182803 RepID=A0A4Y2TVI4_ARAVE|nr:hypothetical protein AVEN_138727-1 [Araneus ventricosus]
MQYRHCTVLFANRRFDNQHLQKERLRDDMKIPIQDGAKQYTSQSEFISLSSWTQFQYWMPSSDSPEHLSNGISLQAYIPESDVKLHLTSVLPQRFPVRHLPKPETKRSLEPHKPLDPNLSKDARSTRSVVPRLIH